MIICNKETLKIILLFTLLVEYTSFKVSGVNFLIFELSQVTQTGSVLIDMNIHGIFSQLEFQAFDVLCCAWTLFHILATFDSLSHCKTVNATKGGNPS